MQSSPTLRTASKSWIEHVAWKPRVFIYHNFITEQEAKHLIELAAPSVGTRQGLGLETGGMYGRLYTSGCLLHKP